MFPAGSFAPLFLLMAAAGHLGLAVAVGLIGFTLAALLRPRDRSWRSVVFVGLSAAFPGAVATVLATGVALLGPKNGREAVMLENLAFYSMFAVPTLGCVVAAFGLLRLRSARP